MELLIVEVQTNWDTALVMPGAAGLVPTSAEVQAGRTRPQGRLNSFLESHSRHIMFRPTPAALGAFRATSRAAFNKPAFQPHFGSV